MIYHSIKIIRRLSHLIVHKWKDTGERPFFCAICMPKFFTKNDMLRHAKKHSQIVQMLHQNKWLRELYMWLKPYFLPKTCHVIWMWWNVWIDYTNRCIWAENVITSHANCSQEAPEQVCGRQQILYTLIQINLEIHYIFLMEYHFHAWDDLVCG
jgi:hypothetical protein